LLSKTSTYAASVMRIVSPPIESWLSPESNSVIVKDSTMPAVAVFKPLTTVLLAVVTLQTTC
jgi:hypothetical protein